MTRIPTVDEADTLAQLLRWQGIDGFVREYRFAPPRRWRFDLAFSDRLLAVEVDGGGYVSGRHSRGRGIEDDAEKQSHAAMAGWRVVRCTPGQVRDGLALEWIIRALAYGGIGGGERPGVGQCATGRFLGSPGGVRGHQGRI